MKHQYSRVLSFLVSYGLSMISFKSIWRNLNAFLWLSIKKIIIIINTKNACVFIFPMI